MILEQCSHLIYVDLLNRYIVMKLLSVKCVYVCVCARARVCMRAFVQDCSILQRASPSNARRPAQSKMQICRGMYEAANIRAEWNQDCYVLHPVSALPVVVCVKTAC